MERYCEIDKHVENLGKNPAGGGGGERGSRVSHSLHERSMRHLRQLQNDLLHPNG